MEKSNVVGMESTDGCERHGSSVSAGGSGCFTAPERKRFRKEKRAAAKRQADGTADRGLAPSEASCDFSRIPTSAAVLTASLRRQLMDIASAKEAERVEGVKVASSAVPNFKVGTLEMYKRFPEAYEALMDRHDCHAVKEYLLHDVIDRIVRQGSAEASPPSPSPSCSSLFPVRVADFGCGAGRIEAMVAAHPAVSSLFAYDGEPAMLPRCLVNTVKAAKLAGARSGVRIVPTGAEEPSPSPSARDGHVWLPFAADAEDKAEALEVVVRPCTFQSVQAGLLRQTRHRKCQVIVCAWSFSYLMRLQWGETRWHAAVDAVVEEFLALLDTRATDAAIVVVETLGSGTATPTRSNSFTQRLEEVHGFVRRWVRTDYTFADTEEAARMTRFFFGERVAQQQLSKGADAEKGVVWMECTGIWTLWKPRGS